MPTSNPYYEPCPDCGMLLGIGTVKHTCGSVVEPKRENAALRKRVEELVSLTRALLESQGELLEPAKHGASALAGRIGDCTCSVSLCKSCRGTEKALNRWDKAIARAERIRKGEV